ncbi:hypothetical protein BDN72DRAFT_833680 [Pluteus cervinus]|uniref:Uncharacterized protein n=1 Tax=Pluteus cervinus TaxID=181527 RepID=A0ACD3B9T1_9AGAR|nr:hypothetical protein BDN72DRAFT_833680 [Pluteus cervinus]
MDSLLSLGLTACCTLFEHWRASRVDKKVEKWTTRTKEALDEVLAVRDFVKDTEVQLLCDQVDQILKRAEALQAVAVDQKTSWFTARKQTKAFCHESRDLTLTAQRVSAQGKSNQARINPHPHATFQAKPVNKPSLLARILNTKQNKSVEVLTDVVNAWAKGLETSAEVCEQVGSHPGGCNAHVLLTSAVSSTNASGESTTQTITEEAQFLFDVQATGQIDRAMEMCTCRGNSLELPSADEPPPPYSEFDEQQ